MQYHQQLTESIEDQLSLASIHYQRSHYQVRGKEEEEGGAREGLGTGGFGGGSVESGAHVDEALLAQDLNQDLFTHPSPL